MVPIIHMNVRYFEMTNGIWWFGGGIDLTPHYINVEDGRHFHKTLKDVCDQHHPSYYPEFKNWADDYFYLKHRNETRGIGGIFFDYLKNDAGFTKESRFDFIQSLGNSFAPLYIHYMLKNQSLSFTERKNNGNTDGEAVMSSLISYGTGEQNSDWILMVGQNRFL